MNAMQCAGKQRAGHRESQVGSVLCGGGDGHVVNHVGDSGNHHPRPPRLHQPRLNGGRDGGVLSPTSTPFSPSPSSSTESIIHPVVSCNLIGVAVGCGWQAFVACVRQRWLLLHSWCSIWSFPGLQTWFRSQGDLGRHDWWYLHANTYPALGLESSLPVPVPFVDGRG